MQFLQSVESKDFFYFKYAAANIQASVITLRPIIKLTNMKRFLNFILTNYTRVAHKNLHQI